MSPTDSAPPTPASPPPGDAAPGSPGHLVGGFLLLTACLEAGEACKRGLHLILPGSILGLFLLLALLASGALPLRWVASAARWLLWLLPMLFMPVFTLTLKDRHFWLTEGRVLAGLVLAATAALLVSAGWLAQWLLRSPARRQNPEPAPPPARMEGAAGFLAVALPLGACPWLLGVAWPDLPPLGPVAVWSALTAAAYFACRWVYLRTGWPVLYPGLTGLIVVGTVLVTTGHPDAAYARETAWITWLLGPAVVAMAVPIYQLRATVRANRRVLALVIPLALLLAVVSTSGLLVAAGRPRHVVAAAGALKSITSPVGLRLAQDAHVPTDAALASMLLAGMFGATLGTPLMRLTGVRDERALGLALGCTSHGIGVARALETSRLTGAFASLGMTGTAMLGAVVLPYVLRWMAGSG